MVSEASGTMGGPPGQAGLPPQTPRGSADDRADPSSEEAPLCVVLCNAPPERAEAIAEAVLSARLAACVSILPGVVSLYWWKGVLSRDAESTLLIKTRVDLVDALTAAIRAAHPYEVPEVIALPIAPGLGNAAYHAWVQEETRAGQSGPVGGA